MFPTVPWTSSPGTGGGYSQGGVLTNRSALILDDLQLGLGHRMYGKFANDAPM